MTQPSTAVVTAHVVINQHTDVSKLTGKDVILTPVPEKKIKRKRCAKCRKRKPRTEFGTHETSSDGRQSYCNGCKNALHKTRRKKNVRFYLKHHFASRILRQLGDNCPENLTKDLEDYLGYTIGALRRALDKEVRNREGIGARTAIAAGYHIDHCQPLSSFNIIINGEIDWLEFKRCWAIDNLKLISAEENLAKGAKWDGN